MEWTQEAWSQKLKEVPIKKIEPHEWPAGIRPISLDEEGLGIDKEGTLYWHLKPVAMRVKLRCFELTLAVIATGATLIQAITSIIALSK
jgi:hypothetical protein